MTDYEAAFRTLTDKWHESVKHYEDRIEKLEAALRDLCDGWECCAVSRSMRAVARKALDAK
jgi:hypothetical protein